MTGQYFGVLPVILGVRILRSFMTQSERNFVSIPSIVGCPHCQGQINNSPQLAGQRVRCPHCKGSLVMPAASRPPSPVQSRPASPMDSPAGGGSLDFLDSISDPEAGGFSQAPQERRFGFRCPFCGHGGPPGIKKIMSAGGWVLFCVLLLLCFPFCWLPFVLDGCRDEERKCRSCGCKIG